MNCPDYGEGSSLCSLWREGSTVRLLFLQHGVARECLRFAPNTTSVQECSKSLVRLEPFGLCEPTALGIPSVAENPDTLHVSSTPRTSAV